MEFVVSPPAASQSSSFALAVVDIVFIHYDRSRRFFTFLASSRRVYDVYAADGRFLRVLLGPYLTPEELDDSLLEHSFSIRYFF